MKNTLWVLLAISLLIPCTSSAYTYLSGNLPDTLHVEDSPFMVLSELTCSDTYVEAGCEIIFTAGTRIKLENGTLVCVGTEQDSVLMYGFEGATWNGISGGYNYLPNLRLEYTRISGASGAIDIGGSDYCIISHCTLVSSHTSIKLDQRGSTNTTISETHIESGWHGVAITYNYLAVARHVVIQSCDIRGNGNDSGIALASGTSGSTYLIQACTIRSYTYGIANTLKGAVEIVDNDVRQCEEGLYTTKGNITVSSNIFTENTIGVRTSAGGLFRQNELYGNTDYDVFIESNVLNLASVDFQENDWGSETTAEMDAEGPFSDIEAIYDWWDDNGKSLCDYNNWITSGVPTQSTTWGSIKASWQEDE